MTIRCLRRVFCLNGRFLLDRLGKDAKFRSTVNGLYEFETEEVFQELRRFLSTDPARGTKPRFYYMVAVWKNLKEQRHNNLKNAPIIPNDSPVGQLVAGILGAWGGR